MKRSFLLILMFVFLFSFNSAGQSKPSVATINAEGDTLFWHDSDVKNHHYLIVDGLLIVFSKDGKVETQQYIKNGKSNGSYKRYYSNNRLAIEGAFVDGAMCGEWLYYNKRGKIRKKENYNSCVL